MYNKSHAQFAQAAGKCRHFQHHLTVYLNKSHLLALSLEKSEHAARKQDSAARLSLRAFTTAFRSVFSGSCLYSFMINPCPSVASLFFAQRVN
jgi:hypothetical protein